MSRRKRDLDAMVQRWNQEYYDYDIDGLVRWFEELSSMEAAYVTLQLDEYFTDMIKDEL